MQIEKYGLKINVHYTVEVPEDNEDMYGRCAPPEWKISQIDVQNADGVLLASTTFTPDQPFQGASPSQSGSPSGDQLTQLAQEAAWLKAEGLAPSAPTPGTPSPLPLGGGALTLMLAGIARREDASSVPVDNLTTRPEPRTLALQASATALTNGNFASAAGWSTTGNVSFGSGAVTLGDGTDAPTRLSQAFTLGANDHFLRFTLSNVSLQNPGDLPEDAFQVALLNAATGASVTAPVNLSLTDALLNLQGDGQRYLGQNVTATANADGSTTYFVDLRNVPTGTAVNLAFDLIGFAPSGSHVTISDVATFAVPHANDATFSGLENGAVATTLTGNVLANEGNVYGATPVIVQGPAHGKLTLAKDGSFVYTPDYLYYGTDSFRYALTNDGVQSNAATVSLTVKYVNQPPVAKDATLKLLENGSVSLDLHSVASDVDGDTLSFRIVTAPQHGTLTQNANGTLTYTPNYLYYGNDSFRYVANDGQLDSDVATVTLAVAYVNQPPVARNTSFWLHNNQVKTIDLRADASDVDGDTVTVRIVKGPQHGDLVRNADGTYTYRPTTITWARTASPKAPPPSRHLDAVSA